MNKINSMCRVCLIEKKSGNLIFEGKHSKMKYSELIREYTGLEIIYHENLPSNICDDCTKELMVVVQFNDKCRQSNNKLHEIFNFNVLLNKNEVEIVFNEDEDISKKEYQVKEEITELDDIFCESLSNTDAVDEVKNKSVCIKTKNKILKRKFTKQKTKFKSNVQKKLFKCDVCNFSVPNKSALIIHSRKHTKEKPYQCPVCQRCFALRGTLKEHIDRIHRDDKSTNREFICDVCGKSSIKKCHLVVHMRTHTKEKPYICSYCPQSFSQSASLIKHTRIHTGEKPFSCDICGKQFSSHSGYNSHRAVHTDAKEHVCPFCDKPLKTKNILRQHITNMHETGRPHICDKCGAAFNLLVNLKSHILKVHSELSGDCRKCKRSFSNIEVHMRIHNGEKPFECSFCKQMFSFQRSLTRHLIRHHDSNEFPCPHDSCGSTFSLQFKLNYHMLKCHPNPSHNCDVCSEGFYRSCDLLKHINNCHRKEIKLKPEK